MSKFVHLHTHSHYSLLDGLAKIDELVNRVKELGMDALAVTDHGNLYGAIEFYKKAKAAGIKPILGMEAYVAPASRFDRHLNHNGGKYHHLILLAKNQAGWKNLIQLATKGYLEGFYYKPRVDKELLGEHREGLIALSGCLAGEVARHLLSGRINEAEETARYYQETFGQGNFYLEIGDHPGVPDVKKLRPLLIELSKKTGIPLAATQDIHYLKAEDMEYHEILLAVQTGNKLDDPERLSFKQDKFYMTSPEEMAEKFRDIPEALQSTVKIAEACNLELELGKVKLPKFELPRGETANSFLEKLVAERVKNRYPEMTEEVKKRIAYELGVIEKTGFADYFLIVQDFVNWAKERQIVVGPGRGSAAGSIVSYILNITDIDPLKYDLLFERFLNPDRIAMPDIDIDFTDVRRDEVLGYLREKYGEDHVAQIITFGTMAARAGVRDVGRSLGMSYGFCDQIAKLIPFNQTIDEAIKNVSDLKQLYDTNADAKRILEGARHLEGVARHASVHACGTVIAGEPLTEYLPLQRAPQDEKVIITQFEMHAVEDLGLLKMDLLGLRNLTTIEDTVRLIRELKGEAINIGSLPLDDKRTFALLQTAGTVGVFQLECLSGDTIVSNMPLCRLYKHHKTGQSNLGLRSVYVDTGNLHNNRVLEIKRSGKKQLFRLVTEEGRTIKASAEHQFMTANGWKRLADLVPGKDKLLYKPSAKHIIFHACRGCGAQREVLSENTGKHFGFCYRCSAAHFRNPSKPNSRQKIAEGRRKFHAAGGKPWNNGLSAATNDILRANAGKISQALIGRSLEDRMGNDRAAIVRAKLSARNRGVHNPMFGKRSPHRHGGFRADIGHYVRSNWEADFARILRLHKTAYEYEPQTFTLRRANGDHLSYTPDFYTPHDRTFYEIKGWMHELDEEKIALFQQQYPAYRFVLISKTKFAEFAMTYRNLVAWECPVVPNQLQFISIREITPAGKEETYDIVMVPPGNNFIANSFVVHNSSGMQRYLKDLKPTELEDIIAMVSLYRPGPIELIPEYVARKHGQKPVRYLHPKLEPVLKNTYGIMIYQEQLMHAAQALAGFTLAEADVLRKAVGKKIRKLLQEQKDKLIKGCLKNGLSPAVANEFWNLIEPFDRYGFNRCVTGDSRIFDVRSGRLRTVKELVQENPPSYEILSLEENSKIGRQPVARFFRNGKKPVWRLTTRSGRVIKTTANHPFLSPGGWTLLEKLRPGEKIAVPRFIPEPLSSITAPQHKLALLGYLLAEGNFCHPHGFYFYSTSPEEVKDYIQSLETFKNTKATVDTKKAATAVYSRRQIVSEPSEAVSWIDSLGLRYKKATEKFFPAFVYQLSNNDLALLIAKMFQGDGCINFKCQFPQIFYATSSPFIARDLQHFFLRFGILSTIHTKRFKYCGGIKIGYTITINRYDNIQKFIAHFGKHFIGLKAKTLQEIQANHPIINGSIPAWSARGSYDTLPVGLVRNQIRELVPVSGKTFLGFARSAGISERLFLVDKRKVGYLRETVQIIAKKLNDPDLLNVATSDVFWDEIKSIEPSGEEETYDLTIEGTHNFVANDIIVHNSHAASYAMIAYQTAYLKAHYPVEFMASLLNNESGDIDRTAFLVAEVKRMGMEILPPDINKSSARFIPENKNIRFGLAAVKNVGENIVQAIIENRERQGSFKNLADLLMRIQHKDLNKKSLESLAKCGALDSLGTERNQILQNIDDIIRFASLARKQETAQVGLFGSNGLSSQALKLKPAEPATPQQKLAWEKELLGLYVSDHPLNHYKTKIEMARVRPIKEVVATFADNRRCRIAGIIAKTNSIVTKTGKPMLFAKIEDFGDSIEVIVFPETLLKTNKIWKESGAVLVTGKFSARNGERKLICDEAVEL